jgi:cellulose biosynthesis protein BcsQ
MTENSLPKVISISNVAGGSGKTTSAHALAVAFAEYGKKTLLIDLDVKSSLTFRLGLESSRLTIADYLSGSILRDDALSATSERFDFIGSDSRLSAITDLTSLSKLVANLPKSYDIILLDHASTFDPTTAMALDLSDLFIIPLFDRLHDLRGAMQICALIGDKKRYVLHIGNSNELTPKIDLAIPPLDVAIEFSEDIEVAASTTHSVLTVRKESSVSESYRSAAYSVLELIGLD